MATSSNQKQTDSDQQAVSEKKTDSTGEIQNKDQQDSTKTQVERVFVVLNPVAGFTDASTARDTITSFCQEHGWDCDIHETEKDEDLRQVIRTALKKGVDMVIAAGGDGTVSDVVSGMVGSKVPMGILPAGTGNNLARNLAIPLDLEGALALLGNDHKIEHMDVMEVNKEKYYVLNVSVGVTSFTMQDTAREEKRRFGMLAYLWRAIGPIRRADMHYFQVKVDNQPIRFSASEVMIANCKFMGLQPQIQNVEVQHDDGCLDIFIVRAQSLRDYLRVITAFLPWGKKEKDSNVYYFKAQENIQISSESPLPAQADGEVIGDTPLSVRLLPDSLRVVAPLPQEKAR